jgi:hypothetical protein
MMLLIQGCCYIQSLHFSSVLQEDCVEFKIVKFKSLVSVWTMWYSVRTLIYQTSSIWTTRFSVRTPICVQKLRTVPSCICLDVSTTRSDVLQCSTSKGISFPNTDMGRQLQPSGRCGYSIRTLSLIRQVVQKMFKRPDAQTL